MMIVISLSVIHTLARRCAPIIQRVGRVERAGDRQRSYTNQQPALPCLALLARGAQYGAPFVK